MARWRPRSLLPFGFAEACVGCCWLGAGSGLWVLRCSSWPQWEIRTASYGLSDLSTPSLASLFRTGWPETTWPNMVCLAFRCSHGARVMKNLYDGDISIYRHGRLWQTPEQTQHRVDSLTTVRAFASIRHAHQSLFVDMPPSYILVCEFTIIYALPPRTIAGSDISTLDHELIDDAMEG